MKKYYWIFVLIFGLSLASCDRDNGLQEMIEVENLGSSVNEFETNGFTDCTYGDTGFWVANDQDPFFLEISTMLTVNFPPGPPPPPGLVTYEFEFNMCGNQKTTYYRTISDTDLDAVSHYFYWQLISKAGACDGEVRARIVDCGNGSPSEWTDTLKIRP